MNYDIKETKAVKIIGLTCEIPSDCKDMTSQTHQDISNLWCKLFKSDVLSIKDLSRSIHGYELFEENYICDSEQSIAKIFTPVMDN